VRVPTRGTPVWSHTPPTRRILLRHCRPRSKGNRLGARARNQLCTRHHPGYLRCDANSRRMEGDPARLLPSSSRVPPRWGKSPRSARHQPSVRTDTGDPRCLTFPSQPNRAALLQPGMLGSAVKGASQLAAAGDSAPEGLQVKRDAVRIPDGHDERPLAILLYGTPSGCGGSHGHKPWRTSVPVRRWSSAELRSSRVPQGKPAPPRASGLDGRG